jgi:15-cis-phytoene synthase
MSASAGGGDGAGTPALSVGLRAGIIGRGMSDATAESYALCRQIARRTAKNFYYSFLVMPVAKRAAMCAIYAFMRRSDDLADGAANPAIALADLRRWRGQVDQALAGGAATDPILPALADTVARYRIPLRHFHALLDGTEMDQETTRYETFADLYRYCYRVASCVGLVVLPVFGYDDPAAETPGEACGVAFQLTNILRDVAEDGRLGRIYLPLEDLRRFNVSEEELLSQQMTPRFVELMRFEAARAREYYAQAAPLVGMIHRDSRRTLAVMMAIYRGILDKIEARGYAVFDGKIRLATAEKWRIVARHALRSCP